MIALGTLGGSTSGAYAVNTNGEVVGHYTIGRDSASHAFWWSAATGMVALPSLGGTDTYAADIDTKGQIVGWSDTGEGTEHAALWVMPSRDADNDGVPDRSDNCPETPNPSQQDSNGNGIGDACEANVDIVALLSALIAQVMSYDLHHGIDNALTTKLDAAIATWERGDTNAASHELGAFIHQVNAQRGKKLSEPEADGLIAAVQAIVTAMH
jgi:probable HAF family extracellular repeat protein